jgi:AraC-like DNA-binding protein
MRNRCSVPSSPVSMNGPPIATLSKGAFRSPINSSFSASLLPLATESRQRPPISSAGPAAPASPAIAGRADLGLRRFERRFVRQVGVSPKLFARFEAALDRMAHSPQGSWTEVAHRSGHYDQMHMVHDFSRFTGETPTRTLQHFEAAFERQMTPGGRLRHGLRNPACLRSALPPFGVIHSDFRRRQIPAIHPGRVDR